MKANDQGEREIAIRLALPLSDGALAFVLYFPRENRWVNRNGKDFIVELPHDRPSPEGALSKWMPGEDVRRQVFVLDSGDRLVAGVRATATSARIGLVCDAEAPLELHWGAAWRFRHEWTLLPELLRPPGSTVVDERAIRTPFTERDGLQWLEWEWDVSVVEKLPRGIRFVLHQPDVSGWLKSGGSDLFLSVNERAADPRLASTKLQSLAEQIVSAEVGASSWTLMHRFNLCHDLLETAQDDAESMALLFSWLRYSATRHLDWQRHYNTKPRELAHAQERLTIRLAGIWKRQPQSRFWARRMLTTLGRGGDGQRVRDEILQIMHRQQIKETSGHFIEEWHQKLHNNTTPDDVVICQAYLSFLRSNGDIPTFYRTLEEEGVTRDRLRSFERPIKSDPMFFADHKDALISEFENFLRILKEVHAGTDLDSAIHAARPRLDAAMNRNLDALLILRERSKSPNEFAVAVVSARDQLAKALAASSDDPLLRDLLFLDLALEEALRSVIERQNLSRLNRDELAGLVDRALRSLSLSSESKEPSLCAAHWVALLARPRDDRDWALHARSVTERAARFVQCDTDDLHRQLQPKAEFLGEAFGVEAWAIALFSEEVIRGGPAFAVSLLLRHLDPILRKAAGLGGWQVISPATASGRVRVVDRLLAVQEERFAEPTVLIADAVAGSEEVPQNVTAVLTSDAPDLVSHLAVRARNAHVLFATCFEPELYDRLKQMHDRSLTLRVTAAGEVEYEEDSESRRLGRVSARPTTPLVGLANARPTLQRSPLSDAWVLTADQFTPALVGGKANNLNGLRGRLPHWIHLPTSIALPFGVMERTLEEDANRAIRQEYAALLSAVEERPTELLPQLRDKLLSLSAPPALRQTLLDVWQRTGLSSIPWEETWTAVRRVWASKWNERAFLSRRARGTPHDQLRMAVLIQRVVEAEYAFVIHTANPLTRNRGEIYAEAVLGLGETLVGNYPGRALGFVCRKADLSLDLESYPGKSVGLYGKGVIFRSDSNGEDLEGFAGAGLYDSYLAEEPEVRALDYTRERLVWDRSFRDELLRSIARIGIEVERVLGTPQDIEGAVSAGQLYVVQTRPQVGLND
jgi:alpha-glucan,water dikinase